MIVQLCQSISTGKPSRTSVFEGLLNTQVEDCCWYWLGHEICCPSLHGFHSGFNAPVACHNDHRYLFKGLSDLPEHVKARECRHGHIQQYNIERFASENV